MEVSTSIPTTLSQTYESQNVREFLTKKYGWKGEVDDIDWTVHQRALKAFPNSRRQTLIKFVHQWLPVNDHKGNQELSPGCPFCLDHNETQEHMLYCNNEHVKKCRTEEISKAIQRIRALRGDPALNQILIQAISSPRDTLETRVYPDRYATLIQNQNKIGWRQLLCGRITNEFVRHHDNYASLNKGTKLDGEQWATCVVKILWEAVLNIWHHRNEFVHEHAKQSDAHRQVIQDEVRRIYQLAPHIDPDDRQALSTPEEKVLAYKNKSMEDWVNRITPRVNQAIRRTHERTKRRTKAITHYFKSVSGPQNPPTTTGTRQRSQQVEQSKVNRTKLTVASFFRKAPKNDDKPP